MRESRLSGSVEGVLRNPDPYSDPVGTESNDQTYLKRAPFYNAFLRWDEKAGLQRDAIRSQW